MVTSYRQLQRLISHGEIVLVHIDAVPRSMSTVLEIACTQIAEGQVNEPFNRGRCDLDAAARDVIKAASGVTAHGPPMVVTKTIASELDPYFPDWMAICSRMIFAVRNPLIQMASLLERIGNDMIAGRGTMAMNFIALEPFASQVDATVSTNDFRRAAWRELCDHYCECSKATETPSVVVDGAMLSRAPRVVLDRVARHIGRPFDARLVDGWTTGARFHFNNPNHFDSDLDADGISVNAWVRRAHQSTRLEPDQRQGMCLRYWLHHYPRTYRYLIEEAIPNYRCMVSAETTGAPFAADPAIDGRCRVWHPDHRCILK